MTNGVAGRVHLVVGPVGAGKSTYAKTLSDAEHAVRFTLDAWMACLYGGDERPVEGRIAWYVARTQRCLSLIEPLALRTASVGASVVLEIGMLQRAARAALYDRIDAEALHLTVHVVDAPRDVRRARVLARNEAKGETFSMVVPPEVFELASDLWEPVESDERRGRDVRDVS